MARALLLFTVQAVVGCAGSGETWVAASRDGRIQISQAFAGASVTGESAALYFALRNRGPEDDTLESVVVEGAGSAAIHRSEERMGIVTMSPVAFVPLSAGTVARLLPGGAHVMLQDLARPAVAGDSLTGVLHFRSGREISLRAAVVGLTELHDVIANTGR